MSSNPPPQSFFKPGAVVFFKKMLRQPTQKAETVAMKSGYAFGILLGTMRPDDPPPDGPTVLALAAGFGLVTLDSITETMGHDFVHEYLKRLNERYFPESRPAVALVDAAGRPLTSDALPKIITPQPKGVQ